jgi:ribonuclease P protein subunit POP4
MPVTPETLPRHELAGLQVAVVDAPNPDLVGIAGRVVRETRGTLVIEGVAPAARRTRGGDSEGASLPRTTRAAEPREEAAEPASPGEKQVPKRGTVFEFALTDEAAPDREAGGTASKLRSDTAGAAADEATVAGQSGRCEGVAYVTVDGARLLSRPARRTEKGGAPTWR